MNSLNIETDFQSSRSSFEFLKDLGERAIARVEERDLHWAPDNEINSIAVNIRHMAGNMLSRWTDFLGSDGEKPWRKRDEEFEPPDELTKADLLGVWEKGWRCLFAALEALLAEDLLRTIKIRGVEHTVIEAIHRQMHHYSYHVGQIVLLARMCKKDEWKTLSIARSVKPNK